MLRPLTSACLSGLLLTACGGAPESELSPTTDPLSTQQFALCSGLSSTQLAISGISTYQGEMAGNGPWAVSTGSNAVRLEYYVDDVLRSFEDRMGSSGTWYFSAAGTACGTRNFMVKAFPMAVDSAGNRTVCRDGARSVSLPVTEACPTPSVSMSCWHDVNNSQVECTGSASGGSGTYNPLWQILDLDYGRSSDWHSSNPMFQRRIYCPIYQMGGAYYGITVEFKVVDSNGVESDIVSRTFSCHMRR
jgi:hypothetical protein